MASQPSMALLAGAAPQNAEDVPETAAPRLGRLVGIAAEGQPLVEVAPGTDPVPAVSMLLASAAEYERAASERREVVLLFEGGDVARPIIAGFVTRSVRPAAAESELTKLIDGKPEVVEVDGKRVCIEAADEIVLRCGEASITLRRNGRLVVKGAYVETHAKGTNRIKGGSVQIN